MWIWQDIIISIISFSFGVMLIPQLKDVLNGKSLNIYSSSLTAIGLYILGFTFMTLNLWISVISEFFVGTIWLLLFIFSYKNIKKSK